MIQKIVQYTYRGIVEIVGIATLWIVWKANRHSWELIKSIAFTRSISEYSPRQWLSMYALGAVIAILISGALSPIVFNYWHLIIAFGFSLFPILIFIDQYVYNNSKRLIVYMGIIFLYFGCINLIAANDSKKFSYKMDYQTQTLEYLQTQMKENF